MMFLIKSILVGVLLGAGAILPGVSSGVLCVILGIYDKLINSLFGLFKNFKKNFLYILPIAIRWSNWYFLCWKYPKSFIYFISYSN